MLVLSRRPDEKIILPTVPAVIKVVSVQSNLVRLGIDAPGTVPIVRAELLREEERSLPNLGEASTAAPGLHHVVRNRVNNLLLGLTLLRVRLKGDPEMLQLLQGMEQEVRALQQAVAPGKPETVFEPGVLPEAGVA
jgi:carbon storage regulator CsrA